ncbi:MAG: T9SS type A sorting domain-containing protein [Bacteroidales bacterium]|nr:T9SS type A sorting domain-containing protein [Bacteroidales bacterium]
MCVTFEPIVDTFYKDLNLINNIEYSYALSYLSKYYIEGEKSIAVSGIPIDMPDFEISRVYSDNICSNDGKDALFTFGINQESLFNDTITFSLQDIPNGISLSDPDLIKYNEDFLTIKLISDGTAVKGNYTVTMMAEGGGQTHTMDFSLQVDDVDGISDIRSIKAAFEWAKTNIQDSLDLTLYMVSSGNTGSFVVNGIESLPIDSLDRWISDFGLARDKSKINIIIENSWGGEYIIRLAGEGRRIIVASNDSIDYFFNYGDISFSGYFWNFILQGASTGESFIVSKSVMNSFPDYKVYELSRYGETNYFIARVDEFLNIGDYTFIVYAKDAAGMKSYPEYCRFSVVEINEISHAIENERITSGMNVRVYPNPFSTHLNLEYTLKEKSEVTVKIYNESGVLLDIVDHGSKSAGDYSIGYETVKLDNGIYFISVEVKNTGIRIVKKVICIK